MRFHGILRGCDRISAARELQVVLAADPVRGRRDRKASGPVQHEVGFGEDHRVQVGRPVRTQSAGRAERIFTRGSDEDFVRRLDINCGSVLVRDRDAVEDQLYFVRICCFDDDRRVFRASCQNIDPLRTDRDILSVCQRDLCRIGCIRSLFQIPFGEKTARVDQCRQALEGAAGCGICRVISVSCWHRKLRDRAAVCACCCEPALRAIRGGTANGEAEQRDGNGFC